MTVGGEKEKFHVDATRWQHSAQVAEKGIQASSRLSWLEITAELIL